MAEFSLLEIRPENVMRYWETINEGVNEVLRYAGKDTPKARVFNDLLSGTQTLWMGFIDGSYIGFIVTKVEVLLNHDAPLITKRLIISEVYVKDGMSVNVLEGGMGRLRKYASDNNCADIIWLSPRRGWEKRMKAFGAEIEYIIYKIPLKGDSHE